MHKQIHTSIKQNLNKNLLAFPTIVIITVVGIAPFIQALYTSFFHDVYSTKYFIGLENYKYILSDKGFLYSFNISALWAILNVIISISIGLMIAWKLINKKHKFLLIFAICIPFAIPIYISVPIWRLFFHGDSGISLFYKLTGIEINLLKDPIKTFLVTLFINCWLTLPTNVIFFASSIRKISKEMLLSAKIDGANNCQILFKIILPIIKNTTLTLVVLNSIKFFKDFNVPYMVSVGGPPLVKGITDHFIIGVTTTLDILIYDIFNSTSNYGITSAYSIMFIFIIALLMLLWLITKSKQNNTIISSFLILITQIIINKYIGILFSLGYIFSLFLTNKTFNNIRKYQKGVQIYAIVLIIEFFYFINNLMKNGILLGFDFAFFIALIILITQIQKKNTFLKISFNNRWINKISKSHISTTFVNNTFSIITYTFELLLITSSFIVLYLLIKLSFSKVGSIYIDSLVPNFQTLDNFKNIILKENYFLYIKNSLILSTTTSLIVPFIIMPAAFWLKQKSSKTTYSILTFIQIIGIYGGMHSLIPLYIIFTKINLAQTYIPLILIYLNHAIPIGLFTTLAFLEKFPNSLRETAQLEGITTFQYFKYILFPLSLPIILSNVLLTFLSSWNGFIAPLLFLNQEAKFTISVKLYSLIGNLSSGFPHWNLFAAGAIINCLILIIIITIIEKFSEYSFLQDIQD